MPANFDRPHINISNFSVASPYSSPPQNIGDGHAPRIRAEHGSILRAQLETSFREATDARDRLLTPEGVERSDGAYYEVELRKGARAEKLERKNDDISVGATKINPEANSVSAVLFIPDESIPVLDKILEDYAIGDLTEAGEPQRKTYIDPIEAIRRASLFSFWTDDPAALPQEAQDRIWWEVWCAPVLAANVATAFRQMECRVLDEDRWLRFPETTVIPNSCATG